MKRLAALIVLGAFLVGLATPALAAPQRAFWLQGGSVSNSFGNPNDMYLEFSISGADLKLREGTPSSYEGAWNGGPIQFSGNMIVDRSGGSMSYVTMSADLADQSVRWPPEGEDSKVTGRSVSQPFNFTFNVPPDYTGSTVTGSARVEACGGVCGVYSVDFRIDLPTPEPTGEPTVPVEEPAPTPSPSPEAAEYRLVIYPGDREDPLQFSMRLDKRDSAEAGAIFQPLPGARLKVHALAHSGNGQRLAEEFVAPACQNCAWRDTSRYRLGSLSDPTLPIELVTDGSGRAELTLFLDFAKLGAQVPEEYAPLQIPVAVEAWVDDGQGAEKMVAQAQQSASLDAIGVVTAITYLEAQMFDDFGNARSRNGGPLSSYFDDPGTRDGPNTLQRGDRVLYEAANYASITAPGSTPGRALVEGDLIRAGDKVVISACDMVTNLIRDGLPAGAPGVVWVHVRFFDGLKAKVGVNGSVCRESIQFGQSPDQVSVGTFHYWWAKKGVDAVVGHYLWPYKVLSAMPTVGKFLAWVWGNEAAGYETVYVQVRSAMAVEFDEAGVMHLTTREGEPIIHTRETGEQGLAVPAGRSARVVDGLSADVQDTDLETARRADQALAELDQPAPAVDLSPAEPSSGTLIPAVDNLDGLLMVCVGAGGLGLLALLGVVVFVMGGRRRRQAVAGPASQPAPQRPAPWHLVFVQGPGVGQRIVLQDEIVLGRHSDTDVRITDDQVSRRHALIQRQGDAYLLSDLGSRNGTYLNGERLTRPASLRHGDTIGIGRALLRLDEPQV